MSVPVKAFLSMRRRLVPNVGEPSHSVEARTEPKWERVSLQHMPSSSLFLAAMRGILHHDLPTVTESPETVRKVSFLSLRFFFVCLGLFSQCGMSKRNPYTDELYDDTYLCMCGHIWQQ